MLAVSFPGSSCSGEQLWEDAVHTHAAAYTVAVASAGGNNRPQLLGQPQRTTTLLPCFSICTYGICMACAFQLHSN